MYPISLVLDFLQNDIRRFRTKFEETTEASPELVRNGDAMSVANTKARCARNSLILLGAGPLFIAVAFADHGRNDHELARPE